MKYINVKGLDKPISELIVGTAMFSPKKEKEISEMLELYMNEGGNVIDLGRFYGLARSEGVVGKWLEETGKRNDVVIINKCCHPFVDRKGNFHDNYWRVGAGFITDDLMYSLNNMNIDYFDIYLMHRDDTSVPVSEIIDRLEKHRQEGKIKVYGVSNWEIPRIEEAMEYAAKKGYGSIAVNSPSYSLATVHNSRWEGCVYATEEYAKWHEDKDIPLIAWSSLGGGFFANIFKRDGSAPKDIQEAYFTEENFEKLKRANELGEEKGVSSVNIALSYILNQSFPVAAVVGPRNKDEMSSNLEALKIELTPSEVEYLSLRSDKK